MSVPATVPSKCPARCDSLQTGCQHGQLCISSSRVRMSSQGRLHSNTQYGSRKHLPAALKPLNPPQRSKQCAAGRKEARLQQVRQRRSRHLKSPFECEECVLQALRPAAASCTAAAAHAALACAAPGVGGVAAAAAAAILHVMLPKEAGSKERSHRGLKNQALQLGHKLHLAGRRPALHARQQQVQQARRVLWQCCRNELVPQCLWGESRNGDWGWVCAAGAVTLRRHKRRV